MKGCRRGNGRGIVRKGVDMWEITDKNWEK